MLEYGSIHVKCVDATADSDYWSVVWRGNRLAWLYLISLTTLCILRISVFACVITPRYAVVKTLKFGGLERAGLIPVSKG
jgi:hypothetical protein